MRWRSSSIGLPAPISMAVAAAASPSVVATAAWVLAGSFPSIMVSRTLENDGTGQLPNASPAFMSTGGGGYPAGYPTAVARCRGDVHGAAQRPQAVRYAAQPGPQRGGGRVEAGAVVLD